MLWLLSEFRPSCIAIHDDLFVLDCDSGKITFFEGTTDNSTPKPAYEATTRGNRNKGRSKVWYNFFHLGKGTAKSRA